MLDLYVEDWDDFGADFVDEALLPQVGRYVRRVGRPRQDWFSQIMRDSTMNFKSSLSQLSMHRGAITLSSLFRCASWSSPVETLDFRL